MNTFENQVWAYLHNELPSEKREAFESELTTNPELKKKLEAQRSTDLIFKAAYSHADEHDLASELQKEWEAEHPEYQDRPKSGKKIIPFSRPLATAAAVAAVLMLLQPWDRGLINWESTSYGSPPQLRGEAASQPHYSKKELKQIASMLQERIDATLTAPNIPLTKWTLSIHLQDMAKGSLIIEVSGFPEKHTEQERIWNASYDNKEQAMNEIESFSRQIANEISVR
jgi:hypothetical protein